MELKDAIYLVQFHLKSDGRWPDIKDNLEAYGARFTQPTGTFSLLFAGVKVSNTAGGFNLLRTWLVKAEKEEAGL